MATKPRKKKRAIALAGGGPAAGFHIGVLKELEEHDIASFDVWSLSCIGAWVGIYYNQLDEGRSKADRTREFFRDHGFRDTASYNAFPVNKAFAPNLQDFAMNWLAHASKLSTYQDMLATGGEWSDVMKGWQRFLGPSGQWRSQGDWNVHILNNVLAVNPIARFLTSMIYMSGTNGLSNIYYRDSSFLQEMNFAGLDLGNDHTIAQMNRQALVGFAKKYQEAYAKPTNSKTPEIYHNAWKFGLEKPAERGNGSGANDPGKHPQIANGELQLFNNKWLDYRARDSARDYLPITAASLCACSALPYIEQTVKIPNDDNREYSEGALVDTVSFRNLVEDHHDLDEIWVVRIVDYRQIRAPKNLHDSLGNLCQQFAAEVGENDISIFRNHLRKRVGRIPRVVEIPLVQSGINFRWDHANLEASFDAGRQAVTALLNEDKALCELETTQPPWPKPRAS